MAFVLKCVVGAVTIAGGMILYGGAVLEVEARACLQPRRGSDGRRRPGASRCRSSYDPADCRSHLGLCRGTSARVHYCVREWCNAVSVWRRLLSVVRRSLRGCGMSYSRLHEGGRATAENRGGRGKCSRLLSPDRC